MHVVKLLVAAGLFVPFSAGNAMTIEQMKQLRGANMLELRVAEIFTKCGLPDVIADHGTSSSIKKNAQWNSIKMNLSDGDWDLFYGNHNKAEINKLVNSWINTDPVKSHCFLDFSLMTLFTKGNAGILKIDKKQHKTTYTIPKNLYMAHKVIGYKVSLITPLSFVEIVKRYGRYYEIVKNDKAFRTIRYWVLVDSGQMPVALYAVEFEINNIDNTCMTYRVVTSEYEFVRMKFKELTEIWDKYGID